MAKEDNIWDFYKSRRETIDSEYSELDAKCRSILELWFNLNNLLTKDLATYVEINPEIFSNSNRFILMFYIRNFPYLVSAYKLNREGLINPARSLTRTVYEQVMRSYLYIEHPKEAELHQQYLETKSPELAKKIRNQPRQWWSHKFMIGKLYEDERKKTHRDYYKVISWFSHPNQKALWDDFGEITAVGDNYKGIIGFSYDSIKVMQKVFEKVMSEKTIELCNDIENEVKSVLGETPKMIPNKESVSESPSPQKPEKEPLEK